MPRSPLAALALSAAVLAGCHGGAYVPPSPANPMSSQATDAGPRFTIRSVDVTSNGFRFYAPGWLAVDGQDRAWMTCWEDCGGLIASVAAHGPVGVYTPYWSVSGQKNLFERLLKYADEPGFIAIGPGGNAWFGDYPSGAKPQHVPTAVGYIDVGAPNNGPQSFDGWQLPSIGGVGALAATNDAVWFVGGCIGKTSGLKTEFGGVGVNCPYLFSFDGKRFERHRIPYGFANTGAVSLAIGGKSIWYSWIPYVNNGNGAAYFAKFTPPNTFQKYALPLNTEPGSPTVALDGSVWYVANGRTCGNFPNGKWSTRVARITATGKVKEWCLPLGYGSTGAGAMLDGTYWFTAQSGKHWFLGSISAAGHITLRPMPKAVQSSGAVAAGTQHDLWVLDHFASTIIHVENL